MSATTENINMTKAEQLLYKELQSIKRGLGVKERMFEGLLIADIVKDLRVNAEYVIREWILTGKLKAVKLPGGRTQGGYRISMNDYMDFLESIKINTDVEEVVFLRRPEDIVRDFHRNEMEKKHGNN
jgi:hypothetical protein